jgi:hypothetical protein
MFIQRTILLIVSILILVLQTKAAEPLVRSIDIRGLQLGKTTTITMDGDGFGKAPKLLLPFEASQILKTGSTDKKAVMEVQPSGEVAPGFYQGRILSEKGISLPFLLGVDQLPQKPFASTINELPVAFHGTMSGSQILETKFEGTKGQPLMIEIEAQKLGSKLQPVVHLYNSKRLQLAWAWPVTNLHGDCRLEIKLPENDTYTITLHDLEYAAGSPGSFRMKVGSWEFIDQVFPASVGNGQVKSVEYLGSAPVSKVNMPTASVDGAILLPWPSKGNWSGMRPFVPPPSFPEFMENGSASPTELKGLPITINGRLSERFEEDRFKLPCIPKTKIRIDVFAERIGSPVDVGLIIRNEKGGEVARSEDRPGSSDPILEYTIPDNVTSILVCVMDSQGRGGTKANYRIQIEDISSSKVTTRTELLTPTQSISIPVGDKIVVPVWIARNGYEGKVELDLYPAPSGLKIDGKTIPKGSEGTLLTLSAVGSETKPLVTSIRGKNEKGILLETMVQNHPLQKLQPWLATEIAIAPVFEKTPEFSIQWGNLPDNLALTMGMKLNLPVRVSRQDSSTIVRLTLLTSQNTPKVNNQPDPKTALRPEKAVEIQAKSTDSDFGILVPVSPLGEAYDITLQADLLTANKQTVLATTYAPVLKIPVRNPIILSMEKNEPLIATMDPKKAAEFSFKGKVSRLDGLSGDINLAVTGLPPGAKFEPAVLKADKNEFDGKITFAPNSMPNEYKGIKITASGIPDTKQPAVRVNSKELELTLVLKPVSAK